MDEAVDNTHLIEPFLPEEDDGDTFWYAEILDRSKRTGGDNRKRVLRMFSVGRRQALHDTMPAIRALCDASGARAYMRLSPRSRRQVGKKLLLLTAEMVAEESWRSAAYLYARACGRTNIHGKRLWLYDIDADTPALEKGVLHAALQEKGYLRGVIPSRTGHHFIAAPHNPAEDPKTSIALHKDNPTNLYIPAEDRL